MRVLVTFKIGDTHYEVPLEDCWPAIPRIGNTVRVLGEGGVHWIGKVDEVHFDWTNEDGKGPLVWCGTTDARVATEDDP